MAVSAAQPLAKGGAIITDCRRCRTRLMNRLDIPPEFIIRKSLFTDRHATKRLFNKTAGIQADTKFRQPGNLKKEYVPTAAELAAIVTEMFLKGNRMRT